MTTLGVIIGLFLLAGAWIVWRELRNAPLGEQDENGFHEVIVDGSERAARVERASRGNDASENTPAELV